MQEKKRWKRNIFTLLTFPNGQEKKHNFTPPDRCDAPVQADRQA